MSKYETILTVLALDLDESEMTVLSHGNVGVAVQWEDGDVCFIIYQGNDAYANGDMAWYVEDFVHGEESWEYATAAEAIHKMVTLRIDG